MRKKIGVIIFISLLVLLSLSVKSADADSDLNQSRIDDAYECLEKEVEDKCDDLSIPQIAFTILASPSSDILNECEDALDLKKSSNDCWPSGNCKIKDTALAILALNHLGEDTDEAEEWLLEQNKTSQDIIWYLEQDSDKATTCKILYEGKEDEISMGENKKINFISRSGDCLELAQSSFWLKINSACYDTEFSITCGEEFISTLLYKQPGSETIFVLSDTQSAPAYGSINLKIKGKCFSLSGTCNYEDSAWATLALLQTGHDIEDFVPYLIALTDSNKQYLPDAFVYMITDYEEYGNNLIKEQELGNYWEADTSAYGKYYDTALALAALKKSQADQVEKAKKWLLSPFAQSSEGCWKSSDTIRDTAIILWALVGRAPSLIGGGTTYCEDADFFCISKTDCPANQQLNNYFCPGLGIVCCREENLKTCAEMGGEICDSDEVCTGERKLTIDGKYCCLGDCEEKTEPVKTECEEMDYICRDECSENQEEVSYDCDSGYVCCRTKTSEPSNWWIWVLIIGIIVILGVILYLMRDKLKLMWFKSKRGFKTGPPGPSFPPSRPGFPPVRRMPVGLPARRPAGKDRAMEETFKKLKEMTK